jgi:hypothetical protein
MLKYLLPAPLYRSDDFRTRYPGDNFLHKRNKNDMLFNIRIN